MSMTRSPDPEQIQEYWQDAIERMNAQVADALEQNVDAQARFVEAWLDTVEEATDEEHVEEALDGYRRAYETWMDAAEDTFERTNDALEGEDVAVEEVRDTWLNAANQSFKEIMGTAAFAAATGRTVEDSLELRKQAEEATEATIHEFGLPTRSDVEEVGERLVELERRQHAVEEKLDRVLDAIEES